jgi:hypothetical protein
MTPVHIPVIRRGKPYESVEHANVVDHRTGALLATVSQVNAGIIRKDLCTDFGVARGAKEIHGRATDRDFSQSGRVVPE